MSLGLRGFLVAYHRLDTNSVVKKFSVAADQRMFRLIGLRDDSVYLVCVVTRGSARPRPDTQPALSEAWRLEQEAAADSEQLLEADTREAGWLGSTRRPRRAAWRRTTSGSRRTRRAGESP